MNSLDPKETRKRAAIYVVGILYMVVVLVVLGRLDYSGREERTIQIPFNQDGSTVAEGRNKP